MYDKVDGQPATYLGDGVYALYDGTGVWLRANDHRVGLATDKIYLEPIVLRNLNTFFENVNKEEKNA
jgi:hypothetical protein